MEPGQVHSCLAVGPWELHQQACGAFDSGLAFVCRNPCQMMVNLANDLSEIHRLVDEVNVFCGRYSLDGRTATHLNLVLEEIFTNIVTYAYDDDGRHVVQVRLEATSDGIEGEVIDGGRPFNPLDVPSPDVESPLQDRPLGGLGVHFLRTFMSDLRYERRRGKNRLRFKKRFTAETGVT